MNAESHDGRKKAPVDFAVKLDIGAEYYMYSRIGGRHEIRASNSFAYESVMHPCHHVVFGL